VRKSPGLDLVLRLLKSKRILMQALILAAGMGKRLGKLTDSDTKCMLEINGVRLIDSALQAIESAGIKKICIVIGYKGQRVRDHLAAKWESSLDITYIVNSDFETTNNIYSLLLASEFLKSDDTILLESDLIFEPQVIPNLINDPRDNVVLVDKFEAWMDGTVISFDKNGIVNNFISKKNQSEINVKEYFKTVNIYKFSASFSNEIYVPFLESYCKSVGLNEYYESVLSTIANLQLGSLSALEIHPYLWQEIDDVIDHANATTMFSPSGKLHTAYSQRYGGYWRFPKIRDFCYLVNPYFPNSEFEEVLKSEFSILLSEYPSGLGVQEAMAANLFKVDSNYLTVGNGASELIHALGSCIPTSKIGYFIPSFDEYAVRFAQHELIPIDAFALSESQVIASVIELSKTCDYVLLVNPDNPTGRFINPEELLAVLPVLKENNCSLILDESFVDFSPLLELGTVLIDEVLSQYSNLVIVKSISKSYGVAGARLGVIASSDTELLHRIRATLPVWNINSFAEKFLQKITYFQKEYWESCRRLAQTRGDFSLKLSSSGAKVWSSAANFLMIELPSQVNLVDFCEFMIKKDILVKSLSGKPGIPDGNFLRVSVKSNEENFDFISALQSYLEIRH